jgi:hypothetical protein
MNDLAHLKSLKLGRDVVNEYIDTMLKCLNSIKNLHFIIRRKYPIKQITDSIENASKKLEELRDDVNSKSAKDKAVKDMVEAPSTKLGEIIDQNRMGHSRTHDILLGGGQNERTSAAESQNTADGFLGVVSAYSSAAAAFGRRWHRSRAFR